MNGGAGTKNRGEQQRGDEAEVAELLPCAHAFAQAGPSGFGASSELAFPRSCCNPDVLFLNKVRGPGCSMGTYSTSCYVFVGMLWALQGSPSISRQRNLVFADFPGSGFCLPRLSLLLAQEGALASSVCSEERGQYVLPWDQDALPSSMVPHSFSTPC